MALPKSEGRPRLDPESPPLKKSQSSLPPTRPWTQLESCIPPAMSILESRLGSQAAWVDPASLPKYGDASEIAGNAPDHVKQLTNNTLGAYGVGNVDAFAYSVGRKIRLVEVNTDQRGDKWEATAVAELIVSKDMLNGAGMMHGGCMCYIIDNCASFPLVALGLMQGVNGVGVSQALNVFFHAPCPLGAALRITSTSVTLGGRIMTSRCEVANKVSGRMVASALLSKMQPNAKRLPYED
ncbi:hypothetical protein NM688_g3262 [Phlebia brevispora]|uniref:Uncharacterized protein n=1 Tax=Phlebia brevispora TaxID=194682 RepID=A0ACC1T6A7_9APHY|nr:hypothetical protein NM688_g3262 [Phlebia brevispora]